MELFRGRTSGLRSQSHFSNVCKSEQRHENFVFKISH
jgi:hypothetical protein